MTDYIVYNGELYHHGVKGMRWGHRKKIVQSTKSSKRKGTSLYEDYQNAKNKFEENPSKKTQTDLENAEKAINESNQKVENTRKKINTAIGIGTASIAVAALTPTIIGAVKFTNLNKSLGVSGKNALKFTLKHMSFFPVKKLLVPTLAAVGIGTKIVNDTLDVKAAVDRNKIK